MPESNKPFIVTDRRKFTSEGELRPDAERAPDPPKEPSPAPVATSDRAPDPPPAQQPVAVVATPQSPDTETAESPYDDSLPAPTPEQTAQSRFAYEQTADRLDTAIRAANPGADHPPAMNFDQLVQSIYLTAIMQLGGATPEGQKPQVDILGARQSIDMLAVVAEKSTGNLSPQETKLLDSALFELRIAFLEITQAFARSAQAKGSPGAPAKPGGIIL